MQALTVASLVTLGSSLVTATTAFAFSQASSNKTPRVALGIFTVIAASFSISSFIGVITYLNDEETSKKAREIQDYIGNCRDCLHVGGAITLFSLSTLTVMHVFWRTLDSLKK